LNIQNTLNRYQEKTYAGVVDGAAENWKFLQQFVDEQVLEGY